MLVISGSCLGLFQYPLLHLHLKKKKIFPLHLASLFPWQETKGRHCLWKSNPFQTCEHKVRLRESIALQTRRCGRDGGCLGVSWAGGAETKDKTAVVGSRNHSLAPCVHSVAFSGAAKQVPVGWVAVGVAQAAGWWKGSREPAPAYGLEVWLPSSRRSHGDYVSNNLSVSIYFPVAWLVFTGAEILLTLFHSLSYKEHFGQSSLLGHHFHGFLNNSRNFE